MSTTNKALIYITLAFVFSISIRLVWFYDFYGYEPFMYNNQLMINTNDGYYWMEGARDILNGSSQDHDLSPITSAASILLALFVKILPFSFESIAVFLPAFLSSLIVVPIVLISKELKNLEIGFIAATIASIAYSYYNRTMLGYLDTDMLNIVLPLFLLWSLIGAINTNKNIYLLITALEIVAYRWWYPQSYSLEFSFFTLILLYALIFDRKNIYNFKLLSIMLIAMMGLNDIVRLALSFVAYFILKNEKYDRFVFHILATSVVAFLVAGGLNPIIAQLKGYVFRDNIMQDDKGLNLHFFTVMQTIKEAGHISFDTFATRISGNVITFIFALLGYIYMLYKHRIMLLSLPIVGLGFLALSGGLRFTIYATPIMALGSAFLIIELVKYLPTNKMRFLGATIMTLLALYPNITHIFEYKVPTVFTSNEVDVLAKLKNIASRDDYVISWWDYGYPIRYYSDVNTLIDGGKHEGNNNFTVSFMLHNHQDISAKMARLDVEYTNRYYKLKEDDKNITIHSNIEEMTKEYDFNDTNDFLTSLQTDIKLPKKTCDIYFYLPQRMLSLLPTIGAFSNIDLMSGKELKDTFFYISSNFKQQDEQILLGNNVVLELNKHSIKMGNQEFKIKRFVQTEYDQEVSLHKKIDILDTNANISVIYMSNYNTFLIVDEAYYNSLTIQLLVLEEYNQNIFEPVILTPYAKVYKLKNI